MRDDSEISSSQMSWDQQPEEVDVRQTVFNGLAHQLTVQQLTLSLHKEYKILADQKSKLLIVHETAKLYQFFQNYLKNSVQQIIFSFAQPKRINYQQLYKELDQIKLIFKDSIRYIDCGQGNIKEIQLRMESFKKRKLKKQNKIPLVHYLIHLFWITILVIFGIKIIQKIIKCQSIQAYIEQLYSSNSLQIISHLCIWTIIILNLVHILTFSSLLYPQNYLRVRSNTNQYNIYFLIFNNCYGYRFFILAAIELYLHFVGSLSWLLKNINKKQFIEDEGCNNKRFVTHYRNKIKIIQIIILLLIFMILCYSGLELLTKLLIIHPLLKQLWHIREELRMNFLPNLANINSKSLTNLYKEHLLNLLLWILLCLLSLKNSNFYQFQPNNIFSLYFFYKIFQSLFKINITYHKKYSWKQNQVTLPQQHCSICLNQLYRAIRLLCKHSFHQKCIEIWIFACINKIHYPQCPQCRHLI